MADAKEAIPRGLCQCGCGQRTTICDATVPEHGYVRGEPRRYLRGHQFRGKRSGRWTGGTYIGTGGYALVYMPDHGRANNNGYVLEHVAIAERALGRPLASKHPVHHADCNPANNAPSNLVICEDAAYHSLLHRRKRAYEACGDANARPCSFCGSFERQDEMRGLGSRQAVHPSCARQYADARRRKEGRPIRLDSRRKDFVNTQAPQSPER